MKQEVAAYKEGVLAAWGSIPADNNPYTFDTKLYHEWMRGYRDYNQNLTRERKQSGN